MNIEQVRKAYQDKEKKECPITERLVKAGYQQEKDGYIKYAYQQGVEVDYRKAQPTQWWHLIKSYCKRTEPEKVFGRSITCGELIFWMAEVLECVMPSELNDLADRITESAVPKRRRDKSKPQVKYDRRKWNKEIHDKCFDAIVKSVESM